MRVSNNNSSSLQSVELENRLRAERHAIIQALVAESKADGRPKEGWQERASPVEDEIRELEYSHRDALRRRLRETDEAIGRLKAGTYGYCTMCGQKIDRKRLEADPAVSLCLSCQSAAEGDLSPPKM
ncbi:MAG TPA: TraR/DksA C4-type zinc finger protein [Blastocatellia bacterium]|nr:TraR/DksA C4-type zinc finger protein [Blastocatellia bacterium]